MESTNPELRRQPLLEVKQLSLDVPGQRLLENASFEVGRGELVLLVGQSGSGKTALLKLLAGISKSNDGVLRVRGQMLFDGEDLLRNQPAPGRIGILFQDHALFDEWNSLKNVLFAEDHCHRQQKDTTASRASDLLHELELPLNGRIRVMSGGQLQRLALARTLILSPELILYDEPTTGLDPKNAQRVATMIRQAHDRERHTTLIVTHDIHTLLPIADRVLLLEPAKRLIEEVSADQVEERLENLPAVAKATPAKLLTTPPLRRFLEGTADTFFAGLLSLIHLIPRFPKLRYGLGYLRRYLGLTASFGAIAYLCIAGVILGFVSTYFTFEYLPKKGFTEPLFIERILRALGYLNFRVLCPVLLTILVAARSGAAIASDIGNRVYSRQFDALRSLGVKPPRYLLTSVLWAFLISTPLLYLLMLFCANTLSLVVFIYTHPERTFFFWDQNFHRSLRESEGLFWKGTWWTFAKIQLCVFGTACIAYFRGARAKESVGDVSHTVTETIIAATILVLITHFAFAFFEF